MANRRVYVLLSVLKVDGLRCNEEMSCYESENQTRKFERDPLLDWKPVKFCDNMRR